VRIFLVVRIYWRPMQKQDSLWREFSMLLYRNNLMQQISRLVKPSYMLLS